MKKEFNLSEKIWFDKRGWAHIKYENIKEFIRLDGEIIDDYIRGKIDEAELIKRRIKLAGKNLI